MKAVVIKSSKENDFELMDLKIPKIDEDEFLLKVKALGVGVHDGYFFPKNIHYPYVIGIEAAGVVDQVGGNILDFKVGDRLAVVSMMQDKGGVWAGYAVISKDALIVRIPHGVSFVDAAAVLVAGNTALKALFALDLKAKDHLLIVGGSGAIGSLAIQLAKQEGILVSALASKENESYMKKLGATWTFDYNDPFWIDAFNEIKPEGADAIMAIPRNTSSGSLKALKDGGKIISISKDQIPDQNRVLLVDIPYSLDVQKKLVVLMENLVSGKIVVEIEKIYPFKEAIKALTSKTKQHARGKTIITTEDLHD